MGQLVFQATLGGQVNLVGPNTASTFNINVPAVAGTMVTTGDTATVTSAMISGPVSIAKGGTNQTAFTGKSGNVAGLVFFDGTSLANDSTVTDVGYDTSTNTLTANNVSYTGTLTGGTGVVNLGSGQFYKDASGNVGIGTSSPRNKLENIGNVGFFSSSASSVGSPLGCQLYLGDSNFNASGYYNAGPGIGAVYDATYASAAALAFYTFAGSTNSRTERMRIDSSGNVGIGVTPNAVLSLKNGSNINSQGPILYLDANSAYSSSSDRYVINGYATRYASINGVQSWQTAPSGTAGNPITFTQAMTLDSSGNLLVGTTDSGNTSGPGVKVINSATNANVNIVCNTSSGTDSFMQLYNTNATNNGARFYVKANGGIANYATNNTILSDERTKTDINNAGNYLEKICSIPVRTFKYKDQADSFLNLGVIAQEVEAVAPELVDVSGFGETPKDGVPLKAVYQTDLQYALMKCIQEQQAIIEQLQADVASLKV